MSPAHVIWRSGVDEEWRDLTAELHRGTFTAISRSGTARLVDHSPGSSTYAMHLRLPIEGGHRMLGDGWRRIDDQLVGWGRLEEMRVTPCGMTLVEPGSWIADDGLVKGFGAWWMGTPLRLILDGLVPTWNETPIGRSVLDDIVAGVPAGATVGHPDHWCGALYCPRRARFR